MSFGRDVKISGRIGGINPLSKVLARLIPYKRGQGFVIGVDRVRSRTV